MRAILPFLLGVLAATPAAAQQRGWEDRLISRGVHADGRLWLRTRSGGLISIDQATRRRADADLGEEVRDICRQDDALLAVTGAGASGSWTLRRRSRGLWRLVARVPSRGEIFEAMDCAAGRVTLLTHRRIVTLGAEGENSVPLQGELPLQRPRVVLLGTPDYLYVGINAGEWGGGLHRIERATGRLTTFGGLDQRGCEGLVNLHCDPVSAILPAPWRPDCVVAAIGLVHFFPDGRLIEICGDSISLLYAKPEPIGVEEEGEEPRGTAAFFGLAALGDRLLAAGSDGLYRIGPGGSAEPMTFPRFRRVRGVDLSFDIPEISLVVTQIDRQVSVSVGAPMIVPR